jgi:hypothetical protein
MTIKVIAKAIAPLRRGRYGRTQALFEKVPNDSDNNWRHYAPQKPVPAQPSASITGSLDDVPDDHYLGPPVAPNRQPYLD